MHDPANEFRRIPLLGGWVNSANVALANLSRWCTGVRAEHVSDGPRRTLLSPIYLLVGVSPLGPHYHPRQPHRRRLAVRRVMINYHGR
jgi:hypothetical protein